MKTKMQEMEQIPTRCVGCHPPHTAADLSEFGPAVGKDLGRGAYGVVRRHHSAMHGDVAIKTMMPHYTYMAKEMQPDMIREISSLTALKGHPDVVNILGWSLPDYRQPSGNARVQVVLELGEMSLSSAINEGRVGGDTPETKLIMFQLLRGVAHMNALDIWHRDLKPGNVLVKTFQPYPDVKIADFGLARAGPFCYVTPTEVMYTLWYRPPEILLREVLHDKTIGANYTEKAEVWALGIVMWDLLTAKLHTLSRMHLRGKDTYTQLWRIIRATGVPRTRESTPYGWDPKEMMRKLRMHYHHFATLDHTDGENMRLMARLQETSDAWDLLSKMLKLNADQRISVYDALNHPYFQGVSEWISKQPNGAAPIVKQPLGCFAGLLALQRVEDTVKCLNALPGKNEDEKLLNYGKVTTLMMSFQSIDSVAHLGDLGEFSLAIQMLLCSLGSPGIKAADYHSLATLALSCMTLASKYLARRPVGIGAVVHSLGDIYEHKDIAQYEALLFRLLGGMLHLPTAYRMVIALVGCPASNPTSPEQKMHASVYAWAVGLLHLMLTTRVAFAGTPSEIAMLATQMSAHYHQRFELGRLPGCCSADPQNKLCVTALIKGAKIAYDAVAGFPEKIHAVALVVVTNTVRLLSPFPVEDITLKELLAILEGEATIVLPDLEESEDLTPPQRLQIPTITATKRQRMDTTTEEKKGYPLLSPDLTFSLSDVRGTKTDHFNG